MAHTNERSIRAGVAALVLSLALVGAVGIASAKPPRAGGPGGDVETRIKTLHSQLRITQEQEAAWNDVAQAMRDNAKDLTEARKQQTEAEKTANAPDVINGYAKTMDTHASAVHKFASAFQTLYDGMSDGQKKTADTVFRNKVREASARMTRNKS